MQEEFPLAQSVQRTWTPCAIPVGWSRPAKIQPISHFGDPVYNQQVTLATSNTTNNSLWRIEKPVNVSQIERRNVTDAVDSKQGQILHWVLAHDRCLEDLFVISSGIED